MLMVFGSIPAIFVRPWFGIIMWCWIGFMNPHRMTWGFAFDFPFAMLIGVTTLLAVILSNEKKRLPVSTLTVVWVSWIVWMNLSTLFALDWDLSVGEWGRTMKIQLFVVLTAVLINTREKLRILLWVTVGSIAFFGVKGGIFAVAHGGAYRVYGPPGGFFRENNALGLVLVMIIPLMWYLRHEFTHKMARLAYFGCIGLAALAVLSTHSRGAFLSITAIVGFLWLKSKNKLVLGIAMFFGMLIILGIMPEHWWERMASIKNYEEDGSAMGRINAWWFAFRLALDHPFTGGGFATFTPELFMQYAPEPERFHDSHSIIFEVLAEHGFVGLGLFLTLGFSAFRTGGWLASLCRKEPSLQWAADLARMCQVSILGYWVGGQFLGLAYFDLYYHVIAILIILRMLVLKELKEIAQPSTVGGSDRVEPRAAAPAIGGRKPLPGDRFANSMNGPAAK